MRRLVAFVAGLVVGSLGTIAALFALLADREPVTYDVEQLSTQRSAWVPISRRQLTELVEDGYGPGGVMERMIRDGLGLPQRTLAELRSQRDALLAMGVPPDQLEPLLDDAAASS